jgi:hypothetical protein
VSPHRQSLVRLLAIVGAVNLAYLVIDNVPIQWFTLNQSGWIDEITGHRSYLVGEMCGPGTLYHCPDKDLPIPRAGAGFRIDPAVAALSPGFVALGQILTDGERFAGGVGRL